MSRRLLQPRNDICQLCDFMLARELPAKRTIQAPRLSTSTRSFSTAKRLSSSISQNAPRGTSLRQKAAPTPIARPRSQEQYQGNTRHPTEAEFQNALIQVKATCNELLATDIIPAERDILRCLMKCQAMANLLTMEPPSDTGNKKHGATSALLSLDESASKQTPPHKVTPGIQSMMDEVSNLVYSVVKLPSVFISPAILDSYVDIQATLGAPEPIPEILHLYANKPVAKAGTSPIQYSRPSPNKITNAIPKAIADRALQTAINAKRLVPAMDIIQAAYTTTAFTRDKLIRRALLPGATLAIAPMALYTVASQLAAFQTSMDSEMFTKVAFIGGLAYLGFTTTVGVVAVTTANDQMIRVTWAPGVPLRSRWMREEERAAIDKVAVAWGFREVWRRGEEEGEDWDLLREWVGGKAMMLDRVELMEGME